MNADQTEKLKALALEDEIPFWWQRLGCMRNPGCFTGEEAARDNEIADLRAEVERLRAALAAGAAEGGGTSDKSSELICSAPAAGTEKDARVLHLTHERDLALRANRELAKDAERYRAWRAQVISGDEESQFIAAMQDALPIQVNVGRIPTAKEWDAAIDAAIGAHSKAGKDSA